MAPPAPTLRWSEHEAPIPVPTVEEFDRLLDEIAALCAPDQPTIVKLAVPPATVTIGLGAPASFVQLQWSDDPPYRLTVGDHRAQGAVTFFLFGEHHTEIPRRNSSWRRQPA